MKRKLNIAIIGCGSIGARHAEHINRLAVLKAVCDIKPDRANNIASSYDAASYDNIDTMLESEKNLDLVSVCTPNGLHCEHTVKVLGKGFNVLCEKPMALSVEECDRMIIAMERVNRKLFIVKQNRFNPPIAELKKLLDENKLGRILSFQLNCFWNRNDDYYKASDWKGTKKFDGGILFTQYSHFIDLACWMFGHVTNCRTITRNFIHGKTIEFEDSGASIIEFENGVIGTINFSINAYRKNMEGSITLFGEKGTVKIGGQYVNTVEYQNIDGLELKSVPVAGKANDYGFYQGSMSNHDKVYECVISDITNNTSLCVGAIEGRMTVEAIEKIYASGI